MMGSSRQREPGGASRNGRVCGPPRPPWNEISSSNAQPSSSTRVVEAADHDVGDVGEAVGPPEVAGRGGGEGRERVVALDAPLVQVRGARTVRARRRRARRSGRAASRCADGSRSVGISSGWRSSISSRVSRCLLCHQVDEPEVAGPEDDDLAVGDVVLRALLGALRPVASSTARLHHRVLLVAAGDARHAAAAERPLDELVEPVAVALLERRALGLPVVGEHDDLVRPRGVAARAGEPAELLVELAQRLHRVGALAGRSGARPRRSSRTSRRPRGGRASCRSARRRRSGRAR